ncbi:MAG: helix-turn-helix domain-containing protein [Lachnospiraceae bacterium]|nr:helix-turn-helix domain-containing protein [Lachnospiraceae bacterium]
MTIGQRIRARRKELHISADELGKMLGKDRSTIFRYEKGDIENLPLDILKPIADALDVTPSYLMGWEPEMEQIPYLMQYAKMSVAMELLEALSDEGLDKAIDHLTILKKAFPKEEEPLLNAAHERTDIEVTEEMRKHDDDIMDDDNF